MQLSRIGAASMPTKCHSLSFNFLIPSHNMCLPLPLRFSGFDPTAADVSSNLREPFLKRVQASDA